MTRRAIPGAKWAKRDRRLNMPGTPVDGALVRVVRISLQTGSLTVEFKENRGAYLKGVDRLVVQPYQLKESHA